MFKKTMVGCPVRNRAWILPDYLKALDRLDYPPELLEFCFIVNDSQDNTGAILKEFSQRRSTRLVIDNQVSPPGYKRGNYSFSRLAGLRNRLLAEFKTSDCQYLFSVDSDILVPTNALSGLMSTGCDVVSALVGNGYVIDDNSVYNVLCRQGDSYLHMRDFPRDRLFEVDCTGAAYLIKRWVIDKAGVVYSAQWGPEDIGFCRLAQEQGIRIYCHPGIKCNHIMEENYSGIRLNE